MRRRIKKRHIVLTAINIVLLILFAILSAVSASVKAGMQSQQAADRWGTGSDIPFAQISCFISTDAAFKEDRIMQLRTSLDDALKGVSITANPGAKLWIDTYSTEIRLTAQTDRGNVTASVTAAGGHFFLIHPLRYIFGYAFSPDDIMQDRVILDTDAAWQLFGSFDITGRKLNIGGKNCVVAGVAERESDIVPGSLFDLAYGGKPRIYISYSLLESISPGTPITCYEAVMPNPISSFAAETITNKIGIDASDMMIIENSTRYDFFPLTETIGHLATRSMRSTRIIYPYWENIAGVIEDKLAMMLLVQLICAVTVGTSIFIFAVKFIIDHPVKRETISDYKDKLSGFFSNLNKKTKNKNRRPGRKS